jgi:hypothetical protein
MMPENARAAMSAELDRQALKYALWAPQTGMEDVALLDLQTHLMEYRHAEADKGLLAIFFGYCPLNREPEDGECSLHPPNGSIESQRANEMTRISLDLVSQMTPAIVAAAEALWEGIDVRTVKVGIDMSPLPSRSGPLQVGDGDLGEISLFQRTLLELVGHENFESIANNKLIYFILFDSARRFCTEIVVQDQAELSRKMVSRVQKALKMCGGNQ